MNIGTVSFFLENIGRWILDPKCDTYSILNPKLFIIKHIGHIDKKNEHFMSRFSFCYE